MMMSASQLKWIKFDDDDKFSANIFSFFEFQLKVSENRINNSTSRPSRQTRGVELYRAQQCNKRRQKSNLSCNRRLASPRIHFVGGFCLLTLLMSFFYSRRLFLPFLSSNSFCWWMSGNVLCRIMQIRLRKFFWIHARLTWGGWREGDFDARGLSEVERLLLSHVWCLILSQLIIQSKQKESFDNFWSLHHQMNVNKERKMLLDQKMRTKQTAHWWCLVITLTNSN